MRKWSHWDRENACNKLIAHGHFFSYVMRHFQFLINWSLSSHKFGMHELWWWRSIVVNQSIQNYRTNLYRHFFARSRFSLYRNIMTWRLKKKENKNSNNKHKITIFNMNVGRKIVQIYNSHRWKAIGCAQCVYIIFTVSERKEAQTTILFQRNPFLAVPRISQESSKTTSKPTNQIILCIV